jgi:BirA family transcriptional regulator, biotin operon repressor / biotin---[acetyl-CoA-carboxylase] ligase
VSREAASMTLGSPRVHLRKTDSTNDRARELALHGAPHGTLVSATEQTTGRGRHGRRWWAPAGSCLLTSLLLRWDADEQPPSVLPLRAAMAVCDVCGPQALVKWPNDVVLRSDTADLSAGASSGAYGGLAKLAGILIEGRPQQRWLVAGIGVNVALTLAELPEEVRATAATLGRSSDAIEPTLLELLQALARRLAEPNAEILAAWRERDALLGSQVSWSDGVGIAAGVDDDGRLLVRRDDESLIALDSGEVRLAPWPPRTSGRQAS